MEVALEMQVPCPGLVGHAPQIPAKVARLCRECGQARITVFTSSEPERLTGRSGLLILSLSATHPTGAGFGPTTTAHPVSEQSSVQNEVDLQFQYWVGK
jgi:hypothetical protein